MIQKCFKEINMKMSFKWCYTIALSFVFVLSFVSTTEGQELGYNIGIGKIGYKAKVFQPVYGFSIGYQFNKNLALETNLLYSQRSVEKATQADYINFIVMPKLGYFGKRIGVYYAPSFLLNPTLDHSNNENHTYLSTFQSIGLQINLGKKIRVDAKMGYDYGLTGAYFINSSYKNYQGVLLLLGMKVNFSCKN